MATEHKKGKDVAVLVYPGVSMLELTCTYSTFNGLKMAKYDVAIIAENRQAVDSDTPLKIVPHKSLQEMPEPAVLVVMGGGIGSLKALGNVTLRQYILNASTGAENLIGVGTGALLLAACGLLQDRKATTHWAYAGLLETFGARYERQRWVEDGLVITAAGGISGMDMGLMYLARHAGEKNARTMQLFAEYDPAPPYGGIDWEHVGEEAATSFSPQELDTLRTAVAGQPEIQSAVSRWADGLKQPSHLEV